jgi:uncharacterized protein YndB with AHSA1/START domain
VPNLTFMDRVSISMEFIFRASPNILYTFLTTPSCLTRWFCDEIDISGTYYTFFWNGAEEVAELIMDIEDELLRFQWEDADDGEFLEFQISQSPVTSETILVVTDFCDANEKEDQKRLWINQMEQLRKATGG